MLHIDLNQGVRFVQAQASRFTSLSGPQRVTAERVQAPAYVLGFFLPGKTGFSQFWGWRIWAICLQIAYRQHK